MSQMVAQFYSSPQIAYFECTPGLVTMNEVGAESRARAPLVGGVAAHDEGTEQSE